MTDDRRRPGSTGAKKGGPSDPVPTFDLYAVLNVRPDATAQEIREAVATMDGRLRTAAARQRGGSTGIAVGGTTRSGPERPPPSRPAASGPAARPADHPAPDGCGTRSPGRAPSSSS